MGDNSETYAMGVAGITTHENTFIQGVLLRDTLTDRVDRVPFDTVPFHPVWLENLLCGSLDFLGRCRLPGVPVGVCRRGDLNIETDHVVFAGDNHDRSGIGVDCAFCLIQSVMSSHKGWRKQLTSMSGKLVRTTPSITPQTYEIGSL